MNNRFSKPEPVDMRIPTPEEMAAYIRVRQIAMVLVLGLPLGLGLALAIYGTLNPLGLYNFLNSSETYITQTSAWYAVLLP